MEKSRLLISTMFALLLLSGCALSQARHEMEASKATYKKCLEQHPDDTLRCEAFRKSFEAGLKVFRAMSESLNSSGGTVTVEK